ncbi:hypothetical protein [sulfur-oxidizing endosymbiont of Gigantopelta aegis]|uniref:hypothetical protein n=1 Tax=sulfur-oxidizing endosymbiont of Gigantopelta aegis TaxID=2794934 RepID=UPI0018DC432F|nr:hypothetical protein [sulfur-oxidizing endosymbiont of Gigantopelta aegis]
MASNEIDLKDILLDCREAELLLALMCQHFSGQFSKYFLAVSSDFCHFVFPIILVSHVNFKQMKRKGFALWNDRAVPFTQGIFTTVMILLQYLHGTG